MFYKYLTEKRIDDILKDRLIRFSQLKALNDPFENFLPWIEPKHLEKVAKREFAKKTTEIQVNSDILHSFTKNFKLFLVKFGVLSLSKTKTNLLMWSHYTNSYKGFIIGFNSEHEFLKSYESVQYKKCRTVPQSLDENDIKRLLFEKPIDWEYEEEVRILKLLKNSDKRCGKDQFGQEKHLYEFPKDLIQEVIISHNMDSVSKKEVIQYCSEMNNEIKLYETSLSITKYEIEFKEIT
ncbi:DUF2971 domain-containing protein [Candidatus Halobeggiatoa sp. HSG11]|nr:DUF2971 domain-containing protein [Candidatus Halobeggiatoa sp. HSG11]